MRDVTEALFEAFRQDHATLGRGLYQIAEHLRAGDLGAASAAADALDQAAGAHMAFEEEDFYPALEPFLDRAEVSELYHEHLDGQATLHELIAMGAQARPDAARGTELLKHIELMEHHVSECGELFGAMGGLDPEAQRTLLARLQSWRDKAPRWTELKTPKP